MSRAPTPSRKPRERILVCGVLFPGHPPEHDGPLTELRALLEAAGAEPVGHGTVQRKPLPDPGTLMGMGKVEEIAREVELLEPDAVAVDNDLTPGQIRNLEKAWKVRVLDRSEVILDIFARRARTRQARLQVELAQAQYLLPRLKRMWTHLERNEGAIGTRGPGETQLETDKRLLRKRVLDLRRELVEIEERRLREVRSRSDQFTVGLVGYTNAGKSTLLNRLTGSDELAADMLFATLDTRTRQWRLGDGRTVLLSDTVGFLQRLPHHLVASFHATLEEAIHADLLLHVVDASHPDAASQLAAVEAVLDSIAPTHRNELLVFNKVDAIGESLAVQMLGRELRHEIVQVSARTGEGVERLVAAVARRLDARSARVELEFDVTDGRGIAMVRRIASILEEELIEDRALRMVVRISEAALGNLKRSSSGKLVARTLDEPLEPRLAADS
jgi:GTP-binding protein HflX